MGIPLRRPTGAVTGTHILDATVDTADLATDAVTTAKIADDAVTTAKLDPSTIQYATVELTATNVQNLNGTPITVVADAAVGADQALILHGVMLVLDKGAAAYDDAASDGDIVLEYSGGNDIITVEADGFIDAAADAIRTFGVPETLVTPVAGEGIQITNDGAEYTTGDGTVNVHVWYSIVDVALA